MVLYFDRPVGAAADLSELEYISALLQTQEKSLRADGSLTAKDVHLYLKSRHAIDFPVEDVEKYIIEQLAGTVIGHKIDIVQLTSLLLIPVFQEYDKAFSSEEKNTALPSKSSPTIIKAIKVDGTDFFDFNNSSDASLGHASGCNDRNQDFSGEMKEEIQVVEDNGSGCETNENEGKSDLKRRNNHSMGFLEASKSDEDEEKDRNFMTDAEKPADLINLVLASFDHASGRHDGNQNFSEEMKEEIQVGEGNGSCSETNENEGKSDLKRRKTHRMGFLEANERDEAEEKDRNFMMDAEKPADLIDLVLSIILQESKLQHGTKINPGVIQEILIIFREDFPDEVVDGMIKACGDNPKLNRDTLLKALTHDIAAYDLSRHQKLSTHYEDACKAVTDSKNRDRLDRFWTASNIDVTADTFGSMAWTILSSLTFILFYVGYLSELILAEVRNYTFGNACDEHVEKDGFFCRTLKVSTHIFVLTLSLGVSSSIFTFFTTLGNSVYIYAHGGIIKSSNIPGKGISERMLPRIGPFVYGVLLLGLGMATTALFIPLNFFFGPVEGGGFFNIETPMRILCLVLGSLLLVTQVVQLIRAAIPSRYYENYVNGSIMASGTIRAELRQKHACIFKVNKMVKHAVLCYKSNAAESAVCREGEDSKSMYNFAKSSVDGLDFYRSAVSDALLRFAMTEDERERSGGMLWTMKKILDGTIYTEEGVWLFPRLVTANIVQWTVVVLFLGAIPYAVPFMKAFDVNHFVDQYLSDVSEQEMLIALTTGCVFAMISSTSVAMKYIISGYSTVLKYRSGFAPSLKHRRWAEKRKNMYSICTLIPAAFYASFFSGLVVSVLVSFVIIAISSQSPVVRDYFNPLLAACLGSVVVFLIKLAVFQSARINWYGAFMRRFPAYTNLYNTIQDAWNIGLATLCILSRLGKLVGIFLFYIGRFDTPLFHPTVGLLFSDQASVEVLSPAFEKSLLLHEAHRHPYIERIGYMYLLKIGCREDFGTQVGAAWRILFTLALFPWLRKYRLNEFHRKVLGTHEGDDIQKLKAHMLELEKKLEVARKVLTKQVKVGRNVLLGDGGKQDPLALDRFWKLSIRGTTA